MKTIAHVTDLLEPRHITGPHCILVRQ